MATSAFTRRVSANTVVQDVMRALGLTVPDDVFESQDSNAAQLRFLLTRAGQNLLSEHDWQFLNRDHTVETEIGVSQYELPEDFDRYVQDASWNRSTRLPAIGSLTESEWQMLKARQLEGTTFTMLFRVADDMLEFYDTPSVVQTIVLPYIGRGWVLREDDTYADNVDDADDTVLYDRQLAAARLRLEWAMEKGFDTAGPTGMYSRALAAAKGKDKPGRTLTLNQQAAYPYLGVINMPDTNYGS